MQVRPPVVAGSFYEARPDALREQVAHCYASNPAPGEKLRFIGAVAPHAGLMYSGAVAAALYDRLELPRRLIILGPNHTGLGVPASMYPSPGRWATPLGEVAIDDGLAASIREAAPFVEEDLRAHVREHSIEVQLPLLQERIASFSFVPLCLSLPSVAHCEALGNAVAEAVRAAGEPVGIIASSDFNHYEDQKTTLRKDFEAIGRILALDPAGLWETVRTKDISMCGIVPATVMLFAARALGATRAELLVHATSGDVNHDYAAVVGYAAIAIT